MSKLKFNFFRPLYIYLSFVLFVFIPHYFSFNLGIIGDDNFFIGVDSLLYKNFIDVLTGYGTRPLTYIIFWIEKEIFGLNIVSMKIISLCFHATVGVLIYSLIRTIEKIHFDDQNSSKVMAYLLSLAYVIHPIHSQAININVQRATVLAAMFAVITFIQFIKYTKSKKITNLFLSLLAYILAILCKENSASIVPIMFVYLLVFDRRIKLFVILIPYVAMTIVPASYGIVSGLAGQLSLRSTSFQYFLTQLKVIFIYYKLILFPYGLRYMYDVELSTSFFETYTLIAGIGHLLIFLLIGVLFKINRLLFFLLTSFYISLLPESSFIPIYHFVFEHRMYLPTVFIILAIYFARRGMKIGKTIGTVAILFLAMLYSLNIYRNMQVETREKFLINTLENSHTNHHSNQTALITLFEFENQEGYRLSKELTRIYPKSDWYRVYFMAFQMQRSTGKEKEHYVERIVNILLQSKDLHVLFRSFINRMVIFELAKIRSPVEFYSLVESIVTPQLEFIDYKNKGYRYLMKKYAKSLMFLMDHYSVKPYLSEYERGYYKKITTLVSKYFSDIKLKK